MHRCELKPAIPALETESGDVRHLGSAAEKLAAEWLSSRTEYEHATWQFQRRLKYSASSLEGKMFIFPNDLADTSTNYAAHNMW
jgi:hypothetical protein